MLEIMMKFSFSPASFLSISISRFRNSDELLIFISIIQNTACQVRWTMNPIEH